MSDKSAPDNDVIKRQQRKDLPYSDKSQPQRAREAEEESEFERLEDDVRMNRGLGAEFRTRRDRSDTEEALKRATDKGGPKR